jgi:hypothetical protein
MTDEENRLYWRGYHFPGTLSDEELAEWHKIVDKYHQRDIPSESEQEYLGRALLAFAIVLVLIAVFL